MDPVREGRGSQLTGAQRTEVAGDDALRWGTVGCSQGLELTLGRRRTPEEKADSLAEVRHTSLPLCTLEHKLSYSR